MRRVLAITMSPRCTNKSTQSRKNMFFKYRKDNRQQEGKRIEIPSDNFDQSDRCVELAKNIK